MSIFMIVTLVVIVAVLLSIAFMAGALYGMDDYDNVFEWIKQEHKINKEIRMEIKQEKELLKACPLCAYCLKEGRYRKSEYCVKREDGYKMPVCKEHWKEYKNERNQTV